MAKVVHDSLRLDAPAAKVELAGLKKMKVGSIRHGSLFPALDTSMEWICTVAENDRWQFDGLFLGQSMFRIEIVSEPTALVLYVKEGW